MSATHPRRCSVSKGARAHWICMYCHQLRLSIDEIYMQLVAALRCFVLEKSTQLVSTLRRFILKKQNRLGIARPHIMTLIILASTTVLVARSAFLSLFSGGAHKSLSPKRRIAPRSCRELKNSSQNYSVILPARTRLGTTADYSWHFPGFFGWLPAQTGSS